MSCRNAAGKQTTSQDSVLIQSLFPSAFFTSDWNICDNQNRFKSELSHNPVGFYKLNVGNSRTTFPRTPRARLIEGVVSQTPVAWVSLVKVETICLSYIHIFTVVNWLSIGTKWRYVWCSVLCLALQIRQLVGFNVKMYFITYSICSRI